MTFRNGQIMSEIDGTESATLFSWWKISCSNPVTFLLQEIRLFLSRWWRHSHSLPVSLPPPTLQLPTPIPPLPTHTHQLPAAPTLMAPVTTRPLPAPTPPPESFPTRAPPLPTPARTCRLLLLPPTPVVVGEPVASIPASSPAWACPILRSRPLGTAFRHPPGPGAHSVNEGTIPYIPALLVQCCGLGSKFRTSVDPEASSYYGSGSAKVNLQAIV